MEFNLKSQAVTLTWQNLIVKAQNKLILNNVSGCCKPGEMLAIMGPSGAGKTTLLSLLASKKNSSLSLQGLVLANNIPFTVEEFYNFGAYIFQNDILHANLTVKQTLQFTSNLKFSNQFEANQHVQQLITTFQLQKCQDIYVGGQFTKGISGGQKKRLSIAVQMISDPDLLILDEPTSGLDSHKVKSVVKVLKKLAVQKNKTIIFTLHQPSFLIYNELDRLLLIHKGKTIYQGKSNQMYSYMQQTLKISVPINCTLSDFFMMEISEYKETKFQHKTSLNHENYCLYLEKQNIINFEEAKNLTGNVGFQKIQANRNFIEQFLILLRREWSLFLRNRMKGFRLILTSLLMVFTAGFIFLKTMTENRPIDGQLIGYKSLEVYLIKAQGTCYIAVLFCIMNNVNTVALNFPTDKEIYYKESSSKKYRPVSYLISKIITQASLCMSGAIIVGIGEYFMVQYSLTAQQLFKFILTLMLCCLIGNSLGFMMGTLFKDARRASALTPIILMPLMMFSGMYTRLDSVQTWIGWIQYISPYKYGLHCLLLNEFHDEKYLTIFGVYDYKTDLQIKLSFWQNITVLIGLIAFFYGLAFILLKKMSSNLAP